MTIYTGYPDAHPETATTDGGARRHGVNQTFADIRAGAGTAGNAVDASATLAILVATTTSNQYSQLKRTIFLFDTTAIPTDATLNSATFSIYGTAKASGLGTLALAVVSSNPASNTDVASGDYGSLGTTSYGSIAHASWSTTGYNDIALSTAAITAGGITKLGLRFDDDRTGTFTGTWASGATTSVSGYFADNGSNKPTLTVDYTEVSGRRRIVVIT